MNILNVGVAPARRTALVVAHLLICTRTEWRDGIEFYLLGPFAVFLHNCTAPRWRPAHMHRRHPSTTDRRGSTGRMCCCHWDQQACRSFRARSTGRCCCQPGSDLQCTKRTACGGELSTELLRLYCWHLPPLRASPGSPAVELQQSVPVHRSAGWGGWTATQFISRARC